MSSSWAAEWRQKVAISSKKPITFSQESVIWNGMLHKYLSDGCLLEVDYHHFVLFKDNLKGIQDFTQFTSFFFCSSPLECEQSLAQHRHQELSQRRETSCAMTPMMRALIELEETRATESRAPCKYSSTTHNLNGTHSLEVFLLFSNLHVLWKHDFLSMCFHFFPSFSKPK